MTSDYAIDAKCCGLDCRNPLYNALAAVIGCRLILVRQRTYTLSKSAAMRRAFKTVVIGSVLAAGCAKERAPFQSPLIGEWQLTSYRLPDSSGGAHPWWDDKPAGLIIYTEAGFMSAQLYDTRRPSVGVRWDSVSADAARTQFAGLTTYYGTYVLDTLAHTVTHTVQGAMSPDWVGRKLVRGYRFISPNEVELRVITDANGRPTSVGPVLVWRRAPSPNER
ncbi:hypothetical protein GEMMAAP_19660 [Gemmatimonas phototrophica]|uniref:Lipocalin-like domain-containing protein n=2 Tax=Gemmatimonas phototrophica TaxID=1379270 RepID=A0A143BMW2_9BACT|nr:hypothetical protein GEMMAAP_19660 [Gemmatimonas phototrophica]